jgi:hypothetical protein
MKIIYPVLILPETNPKKSNSYTIIFGTILRMLYGIGYKGQEWLKIRVLN